MTINYGKRYAGSLTAASPGDTLYIPLQFYNDSGASISIGSTLAVTDIELFKNGGVVERATDSGYAVLGDTGNFDSRIGFKGISISLFNTSDDTGFYDAGSSYWVAIDSVTVDARTVRFFPAVFEIGEPRANVVSFADTGVNNRLDVILSDTDTGIQGGVNVTSLADTGINNRLDVILSDTDTGIQGGVNVTSFADTGVILRLDILEAHADTGIQTSLNVNVSSLSDTGVNERLGVIESHTDTGIQVGLSVTTTAISDTGLNLRLDIIESHTDTGIQASINVVQFAGDTGAVVHLKQLADENDTGRLLVEATATLDTGAVNQAVWQGNAARDITSITDTGINSRLDVILSDTDTGIQSSVNVTSLADTGVNERLAVIEAHTDTGIQTGLSVTTTAISDTGLNLRLDILESHADTGIQTGLSVGVSSLADTGINNRLSTIQTQTDKMTFDTGSWMRVDLTKINDIAITGIGDTGTGNVWRPA